MQESLLPVAYMMQKIEAWKKLKKTHKIIYAFLFCVTIFMIIRGAYDTACFYAILIFFYRGYLKEKSTVYKRRSDSDDDLSFDPLDIRNPSGFTNPASPVYHSFD